VSCSIQERTTVRPCGLSSTMGIFTDIASFTRERMAVRSGAHFQGVPIESRCQSAVAGMILAEETAPSMIDKQRTENESPDW
jgi:hypothetical protein